MRDDGDHVAWRLVGKVPDQRRGFSTEFGLGRMVSSARDKREKLQIGRLVFHCSGRTHDP